MVITRVNAFSIAKVAAVLYAGLGLIFGALFSLIGMAGLGAALIAAAAEADDVPCEIVIGSLREPSDFAGLPVVTEEGVRMEPPAWAKRLPSPSLGELMSDLVEIAGDARSVG